VTQQVLIVVLQQANQNPCPISRNLTKAVACKFGKLFILINLR